MKQFTFYMQAKVLFRSGPLDYLHEENIPGKKVL